MMEVSIVFPWKYGKSLCLTRTFDSGYGAIDHLLQMIILCDHFTEGMIAASTP
jgi:hypothetical protein